MVQCLIFFSLWAWWLWWWIGDYDGCLGIYFVCGFGCVCVGGGGGSGGCGSMWSVLGSFLGYRIYYFIVGVYYFIMMFILFYCVDS